MEKDHAPGDRDTIRDKAGTRWSLGREGEQVRQVWDRSPYEPVEKVAIDVLRAKRSKRLCPMEGRVGKCAAGSQWKDAREIKRQKK